MIQISEQALAARRERQSQEENQADGPITIAYFSGTGSHNRDFRVVTEPLVWALETYPKVRLHVGGQLELGPEFVPFQTRIRRAPYVTWRELPYLIAGVDINLTPLEEDNPFCRGKSEIKFVEAALVGVPTISSRVQAYEFAITDGKDGLLASSPEEWKNALRELLEKPKRRGEIGDAARNTVYARYLPDQRAPELTQLLKKLVEEFGGASATPDHILRELSRLTRDYANQMHKQVMNQEAQMASLRQLLDQYERQYERRYELISNARDQLERHVQDIQQGRVMRFMNSVQGLIQKVRRK
jgi:hypothetical protein